VITARAPDAGVEAIEVAEHPFFFATLFQPQVGALAGRPPSPLITAFLDAARAHDSSSRHALTDPQ
jgi:CTP synthase (UTP-ammonia lyase)